MADDLEPRVRELERGSDRIDGRLGRVEEEIRMFRPIPLEAAEYRAETRSGIKGLAEDMHEAFEGIRRIEEEFKAYVADQNRIGSERDKAERERDERERKEKSDRAAMDRRDRWQRWGTLLALSLTFISMTVGWVILAT